MQRNQLFCWKILFYIFLLCGELVFRKNKWCIWSEILRPLLLDTYDPSIKYECYFGSLLISSLKKRLHGGWLLAENLLTFALRSIGTLQKLKDKVSVQFWGRVRKWVVKRILTNYFQKCTVVKTKNKEIYFLTQHCSKPII